MIKESGTLAHHNCSEASCSVLEVRCPTSKSQAQYTRVSEMRSQFLQMKIVHIATGAMREDNRTAIPRRVTRKVKNAVQLTVFNWDFHWNLIKQKI